MGFSRGVVLVAALALSGALATGCASGQGTQQTVFVTETGTVPASSEPSATETTSVEATSSDQSTVSGTDSTSSSETTGTSVSVPPFSSVDALKLDCAKVMNGTKLSEVFGAGLPGGTNRIVEGANDERGITGRLRCQYGVAADKSIIAVTVVFTQFTDAQAATSQLAVTVDSEKSEGATASTTTVNGYPADILIRDGGLLILNYDTWNMSVVIADNVLDDSELPAALTTVAEYALTKATGG